MNRKVFLKTSTLGIAGSVFALARARAAAPASLPAAAPSSPSIPAFDDVPSEALWEAVRAQYPLTRELAYFNTGGLGPVSERALSTAEKITRQLQVRSESGHAYFAQAREALAGFLGADKEEIAFVRNATEGNSIIASGLDLRRRDEVIFESHAHPGGSYPWLNLQNTAGVVVKLFEPSIASPEENVGRVKALITPRTRVVQVSHVTAPTGLLMPVNALARLCRGRGIWFHVDGAQTAGMFPFSLREIGCDSYATSGHKWLGAPHETGLLFVKKDRLVEVTPRLVGAYSGDTPGGRLPGEFTLAPDAVRYEYATRNAATVMALAEAAKFQEEIGRERIAGRGRFLAARVREGLARIPGVEILTPPASTGLACSIVTFRSSRLDYNKLFGHLLGRHKVRTRPVSEQGLNALRVSAHLFNTPAECERLVEGVAAAR
jgi:selenocysteine lyase/cysteine desulfurase